MFRLTPNQKAALKDLLDQGTLFNSKAHPANTLNSLVDKGLARILTCKRGKSRKCLYGYTRKALTYRGGL